MIITKKDAQTIEKKYGLDLTAVATANDLVALFEEKQPCWFKVVMEADLCDETYHYIETTDEYLIIFITEEGGDNLQEVYLGF